MVYDLTDRYSRYILSYRLYKDKPEITASMHYAIKQWVCKTFNSKNVILFW